MNSVQSMLSIGALVLLSLSSFRFNTSVLENSTAQIENKVSLTAFSLADDMIETIKQRSFDEATIEFPTGLANLTDPDHLSAESGETYLTFDDIDDYNNYSKTVSAPHAENYHLWCKVSYVDGDNPDNEINTRSYYKKVTVYVSSPYMRDDINISFIFTLK
ncbi:MAG TPA: hypothetical protein VLB50_04055 [Ignavibacteriaceae bacterium]|nr:hypothetical protein [Ignavibacteriaceae bacterium]